MADGVNHAAPGKPATAAEVAASPVSTSLWQRADEALRLGWRRAGAGLSNARRRLVRKRLPDYVTLTLDGPLRELAAETPWYLRLLAPGAAPASLQGLGRRLRHVAEDPDVRGVLLIVRSMTMSRVTAQNTAALLARFREWARAANPSAQGKQIVVWLEQVGPSSAVAFAGADHLLMAPQGGWEVTGLRVEKTYLRDALARVGVQSEVVKVAPWKTAADAINESQMSAAEREQYGWLLDSLYDQLVTAIAQGRRLPPEQVRALIDRAPLSAAEAQAAGLVDALLYEDELAAHLGRMADGDADAAGPARLARYSTVEGILYRRVRPRTRPIGLLDLRGAIVNGSSRSSPLPIPLLGDEMLGSSSVQQAVRAARRNSGLAAVVALVDSPGGSATASDLMWRELALLAQEKPLVVYMGDVAASGGYYIAMPGHRIVAQAGTLTGSIGVILAKVVTAGVYDRLHAHRDVVERGANAGLLSDAEAWTPAQRARMEALVGETYATFRARVTQGRGLDDAQLDALAGGRVWTGAQALAHGLVDALGDLATAFEEASRLAGLPIGAEVTIQRLHGGKALPATPAQAAPVALALLRAYVQPSAAHSAQVAALATAHTLGQALEWRRLLRAEPLWLLADALPDETL